jgi:hypothetical protein
MLAPAFVSIIVGILLGLKFRVQILAPVILLTLFIAICTGITRTNDLRANALSALIIIVGLQIGYMTGLGLRHVRIVVRASRRREGPLASSLPPERPAH